MAKSKSITPEELVEQLEQSLGTKLKSVVLYGSAAAGDFLEGVSGHDLLIVAEPLGVHELTELARSLIPWQAAGNPAPQLFTPREFAASTDAFPIELLDMQQARQVLHGPDPLEGIKIDMGHFRLQLEQQLMNRLMQLRHELLASGGKPEEMTQLMVVSVSTFLVLFRAALRLYDEPVPRHKAPALEQLARRLELDPQPLLRVVELKASGAKKPPADVEALFGQYLSAIEAIVHAVDKHIHPNS